MADRHLRTHSAAGAIDAHAEDLGVLDDELCIRPRRMRPPESDIYITPIIDITFLLLIFFLVSAFLSKQAPVDLPQALYGDAVAQDESAIITIAAEGVDDSVIYKGDGVKEDWQLASADLVAQEQELAAYIQAQFDAHPHKRHVLIKADKQVKHRHVARVSHAAGRVLTDGRLFIAVTEED